MQLTHVYAKLNGKLRNVDVDDVEKLRYMPHLFCKLCGEKVSYVSASWNRRSFFRHSPNPSKTCSEKSDGWYGYSSTPIRQRSYTSEFFVRLDPERLKDKHPSIGLEMALPPLSQKERDELVASQARFEVDVDGHDIAVYGVDRLSERGRTYIPLGRCVSSCYRLFIRIRGSRSVLSRFHKSIDGLDDEGMLFSMETGRRIPFQAEVYVGASYLWVGRVAHAPRRLADVDTEVVERLPDGWVACQVRARRYSEAAVVAFIRFGVALCEIGDIAYPLWPCFVRREEMVCIEPDQQHFWGARADAVRGRVPDQVGEDGAFQCKQCGSLQYPVPFMYSPYGTGDRVASDVEIWKEHFQGMSVDPLVEVWDPDVQGGEAHVGFGEFDELPARRRLNFRARSEGRVEVRHGTGRQDRFALKARDVLSLDIEWGICISVYQGLDLIGEISYRRTEALLPASGKLSLAERRYLARASSDAVYDGGSLARLSSKMRGCPELQANLAKLVRGGVPSQHLAAVVRKRLGMKCGG